jgi:hypothetical protein
MSLRIGYGKFGRSMAFDRNKWGFQGDAEAPNLLMRLARRNPDVTWVIVGKNTGTGWQGEQNIENPWSDGSWTSKIRGQPYNNIGAGQTPPPDELFIPYRKAGGGFWLNGDAYRRDLAIADVIAGLDGVVMHMGQHGTSHVPIPQSTSTWADAARQPELITSPQLWSRNYGEYAARGLNALGDRTNGEAPVVWLVTDPRNYLKARDLKWPSGSREVLAQYEFTRTTRHERYLDPRAPDELGWDNCAVDRDGEVWVADNSYVHAGLELMILPDDWETWGPAGFHERLPTGVASTSFSDGRIGRELRRSELIRDYLLAAFPDAEIFGKWDAVSEADILPRVVVRNKPDEFASLLNRWRVTLAMPALGTPWTVAKVFQCFAANVACFMVEQLDDQGWLLPTRRRGPGTQQVGNVFGTDIPLWSIRNDWTPRDLMLASWLRVESPVEFERGARQVSHRESLWEWIVQAQRALLQRRWDEHLTEVSIERLLGINGEDR